MLNDLAYIKHISNAIQSIESYTNGVNREEFLNMENNPMMKDAVIRQFEIIGEAVGKLSDEIKNQYPNLPWSAISNMRNKLIHEYFGVDLAVVWKTIEIDLPILEDAINNLSSNY
jgi:uncharacterized protein with HEPN domain